MAAKLILSRHHQFTEQVKKRCSSERATAKKSALRQVRKASSERRCKMGTVARAASRAKDANLGRSPESDEVLSIAPHIPNQNGGRRSRRSAIRAMRAIAVARSRKTSVGHGPKPTEPSRAPFGAGAPNQGVGPQPGFAGWGGGQSPPTNNINNIEEPISLMRWALRLVRNCR